MTPENENAIRAACRRCTEEIQQAMRKKPKPNWNETVPPTINKHHKKIEALGVSLTGSSSKLAALTGGLEPSNEQTYRTGWANPQQNRR